MTNTCVQLKELMLSTKIAYKKLYNCNIILSAAILDAILIISKCPMMPRWHQSDSSSRYLNLSKSVFKNTLPFNARSTRHRQNQRLRVYSIHLQAFTKLPDVLKPKVQVIFIIHISLFLIHFSFYFVVQMIINVKQQFYEENIVYYDIHRNAVG